MIRIPRKTAIVSFAVCVLVYAALRARWIGHLLTWDEAMNLCSVRALATCSHDHFSNWFWRHPPFLSVLTLLLNPLEESFARRVEIMCIVIGILNLGLLFALNRKVFGTVTALLSIYFLSVMPGSAFFDVWIKRDHTVTTFGLTALLLLVSRKPLYAGLSLGLAFLSKETAVFYAVTAVLLWFCGVPGRRKLKDLMALTITPAATAGWWYHLESISPVSGRIESVSGFLDRIAGSFAQHARLAVSTESGWNRPWNYYLGLLDHHLNAVGIVLAILGAATLAVQAILIRKRSKSSLSLPGHGAGKEAIGAMASFWPLLALVPSYTILSILPSKVPWVTITLFPAWATLQAVFAGAIVGKIISNPASLSTAGQKILPRIGSAAAGVLVFAALFLACRLDYDRLLELTAPGQKRGAEWSLEAAQAMNAVTRPEHRVLLTSFYYWKNILPGQACPVFAHYYRGGAEILMRPHQAAFEQLHNDLIEYDIDWALLSPLPGRHEHEIFGGFVEQLKLQPIKLSRAWLFRTDKLARTGAEGQPE